MSKNSASKRGTAANESQATAANTIASQAALRVELNVVRSLHREAVAAAQDARLAFEKAGLALREYEERATSDPALWHEGRKVLSPDQTKSIEGLRARRDSAHEASDIRASKVESLQQRIAEIESALLDAAPHCTRADIEAHAADLRAHAARVADIDAALARLPDQVEQERAVDGRHESLLDRRERLRALQAMGEDCSDELAALQSEIEQVEADMATSYATSDDSGEVERGLQQLRWEAQQLLEAKANSTKFLLHAHFAGRAEIHRQRYLQAAEALITEAQTLIGIEDNLKQFGETGDLRGLFPRGYRGLAIPVLWDMSGAPERPFHQRDGFLFSADKALIAHELDGAADRLLDEVRALLADTPAAL